MAVPELHRGAVAPLLGAFERSTVIRRFELTEVVDVTAEAVHEVQSIVQHSPPPPMELWNRHRKLKRWDEVPVTPD
jgi:hypothetical protein